MRLLLLSDVHLIWDNPMARLDDVKETQFKKLKFIFDHALKEDAIILQAGDLFNKPRSFFLLPEVIDFLMRYSGMNLVQPFCIFGQHDTYLYSEQTRDATNLGVLAKAGLVDILDDEFVDLPGDIYVYGCSYGQEIPTVDMKRSKTRINILSIHKEIAEKPLWPGHTYADAKQFLKEHGEYDLILCGDVHRRFEIWDKDRVIINTAPILRLKAEEYSFQYTPAFAVYDTDKKSIEWVDIPCEKADKVLTRDHIESQKEIDELLLEFTDSINADNVDFNLQPKQNVSQFCIDNEIEQPVIDILSKEMGGEK